MRALNQMRRAAVLIPSNIAEGKGRSTAREFALFLCHAVDHCQNWEHNRQLLNNLATWERLTRRESRT
jgi:four helix bundle protein